MSADLREMFRDLEGCCLHEPQWKPEDVQQIICWHGARAAENESSSTVVVMLTNGRGYGLLTQSADYTGHGCQCTAWTVKEPSLHLLLGHLDNYELDELIRQ
jgi:hypothetical protein